MKRFFIILAMMAGIIFASASAQAESMTKEEIKEIIQSTLGELVGKGVPAGGGPREFGIRTIPTGTPDPAGAETPEEILTRVEERIRIERDQADAWKRSIEELKKTIRLKIAVLDQMKTGDFTAETPDSLALRELKNTLSAEISALRKELAAATLAAGKGLEGKIQAGFTQGADATDRVGSAVRDLKKKRKGIFGPMTEGEEEDLVRESLRAALLNDSEEWTPSNRGKSYNSSSTNSLVIGVKDTGAIAKQGVPFIGFAQKYPGNSKKVRILIIKYEHPVTGKKITLKKSKYRLLVDDETGEFTVPVKIDGKTRPAIANLKKGKQWDKILRMNGAPMQIFGVAAIADPIVYFTEDPVGGKANPYSPYQDAELTEIPSEEFDEISKELSR